MIIRDILQHKGDLVHGAPGATPVREAVRMMVERDIGSLVVFDTGRMVGLFTLRELLQGLGRHGADLLDLPLTTVMASDPVTGHPDDSVDYVRGVMTEHHVSHLPVLDRDQLAGIISFHDVAKECLRDASYENILLKRYIRNWPEEGR